MKSIPTGSPFGTLAGCSFFIVYQSVAFLFLCYWRLFGGRGHLCFDFRAFFLFLDVAHCNPALNVLPDIDQCHELSRVIYNFQKSHHVVVLVIGCKK